MTANPCPAMELPAADATVWVLVKLQAMREEQPDELGQDGSTERRLRGRKYEEERTHQRQQRNAFSVQR